MPEIAVSKSRLHYPLLALLALTLFYRILFLLAMPRVLDTADAIHYAETTAAFSEGRFFAHDPKIPVLYPLLCAVAHQGITDLEWACRTVSFCAALLTMIPFFLLTRQVFGKRAALLAGIAFALNPWYADYACRVSTEATALLCWMLGAWLLEAALRRGRGWSLLAPLPWLALYLSRAEGMVLLFVAPVAAFCCAETPVRTRLQRLAPFAALTLPAIALNTLYLRALTGIATSNYRLAFILQEFDWLRFVDTTAKTLTEVLPLMLGPVLLLFLGVGLFRPAPNRKPRAEALLFLLAGAQWGASLFVLSPAPRYLMAPILLLTGWACRGIALVESQVQAWPRRRWLRHAPIAALVAALLFHTAVTVGSEHLGRRPREPREYKDAGCWMREHLDPGLIFSRKPQIGFYAHMPSTGPALEEDASAAIERAQAAGAAYLVVDERYAPPGLRPLLDPAAAPESLRHLRTFEDYPQSKVVLYAIDAPARPGEATP